VIPVAMSRMNDGKMILCLNNLRSTNGGTVFLSMITKQSMMRLILQMHLRSA
jgi:hypothetical protein